LHVHLGTAPDGRPVKIPASADLTLEGVIQSARRDKGLDVVGIVDMQVPSVSRRVRELVDGGELAPVAGGGYQAPDGLLLLPACELEVRGRRCPYHLLLYFPDLTSLADFAAWLQTHVERLDLSSQRCRAPAPTVLNEARQRGGTAVPAHIFTPHRGLYAAGDSILELLAEETRQVAAVELGLSADTGLAGRVAELAGFTFLSSSDAHALDRVGRELTVLAPAGPGWGGLMSAIRAGRVLANYGLDPRLGKYHRSFCRDCRRRLTGDPPVTGCGDAGHRVIKGVLDRIYELELRQAGSDERPPYIHQLPLAQLPGVGRAGRKRLRALGDEFHILHAASGQELEHAAGAHIADMVMAARAGRLDIEPGGGGRDGRVKLRAGWAGLDRKH